MLRYCLNRSKAAGSLWLISFALLYILSAVCLAVASKKIPVGTADAVWTGIGALCTITLGVSPVIFRRWHRSRRKMTAGPRKEAQILLINT